MIQKYFSLEEANRALTLIRPITKDILDKLTTASELHAEVKHEKTNPSANEIILLSKLNQTELLLNKIDHHIKELENIGVFIRDLKSGAVDFPAIYKSNLIYLCWNFEDDKIKFWHESSGGTSDRKPIELLIEHGETSQQPA